jgi:NAD(P)-dependent dehydrogenase (short-subunit alcohol dehydrogenase family)
MKAYALAKLYVAWWTARLADKLPEGIRVFAISPGSVPSTNFGRHQSFMFRRIMLPMMNFLGKLLGVGAPVSAGATRYIAAVNLPDEDSGKFFASPAGKMIGNLTEQKTDYLLNKEKQESAWNVIVKLAGGYNYSGAVTQRISSGQASKKTA